MAPRQSQRKATATASAGAATAILLWLLGYYQPDLVASAPVGVEAAITTLIAAVAARVTKETSA